MIQKLATVRRQWSHRQDRPATHTHNKQHIKIIACAVGRKANQLPSQGAKHHTRARKIKNRLTLNVEAALPAPPADGVRLVVALAKRRRTLGLHGKDARGWRGRIKVSMRSFFVSAKGTKKEKNKKIKDQDVRFNCYFCMILFKSSW